MAEEDEPATEGDAAWREQMQETGGLAERLQPPHDPADDRPVPRDDRERDD